MFFYVKFNQINARYSNFPQKNHPSYTRKVVKNFGDNIKSLQDPDHILRKEVIQVHLPVHLPCYDLIPVAGPSVLSCLLAVSSPNSGKTNSHGVTGSVYKARERIHRDMLIRDY